MSYISKIINTQIFPGESRVRCFAGWHESPDVPHIWEHLWTIVTGESDSSFFLNILTLPLYKAFVTSHGNLPWQALRKASNSRREGDRHWKQGFGALGRSSLHWGERNQDVMGEVTQGDTQFSRPWIRTEFCSLAVSLESFHYEDIKTPLQSFIVSAT